MGDGREDSFTASYAAWFSSFMAGPFGANKTTQLTSLHKTDRLSVFLCHILRDCVWNLLNVVRRFKIQPESALVVHFSCFCHSEARGK